MLALIGFAIWENVFFPFTMNSLVQGLSMFLTVVVIIMGILRESKKEKKK